MACLKSNPSNTGVPVIIHNFLVIDLNHKLMIEISAYLALPNLLLEYLLVWVLLIFESFLLLQIHLVSLETLSNEIDCKLSLMKSLIIIRDQFTLGKSSNLIGI